MKNLFKKLKNTKKGFRYTFFIITIINIISIFLITKGLLLLSNIETGIRIAVIIFLIALFCLYFLIGLVWLIIKKYRRSFIME